LKIFPKLISSFECSLVLHGGGNTSVKIKVTNKVKEQVEVIAVKGSGWDLSNIGNDCDYAPLRDDANQNT
jgi:rhamnose utilization protein RhaD (predicted bifunctional aldolase and dehydrogenase)